MNMEPDASSDLAVLRSLTAENEKLNELIAAVQRQRDDAQKACRAAIRERDALAARIAEAEARGMEAALNSMPAAEAIMADAWTSLGGNHNSPEYWTHFNEGVLFTLGRARRAISPSQEKKS